MNTSWLDAARQYRNPPPEPAKPEVKVPLGERRPTIPSDDQLYGIAEDLRTFLNGPEGAAARDLLVASKTHIIFGEERPTMGCGQVYYLDGTGLHESYEAMGMWTAYAKDAPAPVISNLTAGELVRRVAYCELPCTPVSELIPYLRKQLDAIASRAPK